MQHLRCIRSLFLIVSSNGLRLQTIQYVERFEENIKLVSDAFIQRFNFGSEHTNLKIQFALRLSTAVSQFQFMKFNAIIDPGQLFLGP
jgi:hypothetical protein